MSDTIADIVITLQRALLNLKTAHDDMKALGLDNALQTNDDEQDLWEALEHANRQVRTAYNRLKEMMP